MDWKAFWRKGSWPNRGILAQFPWAVSNKRIEPSHRAADYSAEVSTEQITNSFFRRYRYTNPLGMSTTQLYGPHMTTAYSTFLFAVYILLCGLFNDALMVLRRICREAAIILSRNDPSICLKWLRQTTKTSSRILCALGEILGKRQSNTSIEPYTYAGKLCSSF
jgi:hypothetical protein